MWLAKKEKNPRLKIHVHVLERGFCVEVATNLVRIAFGGGMTDSNPRETCRGIYPSL
jgi:hypothetical protein